MIQNQGWKKQRYIEFMLTSTQLNEKQYINQQLKGELRGKTLACY